MGYKERYGKMISCALCGQVGTTLTATKVGKLEAIEYHCQDTKTCKVRRFAAQNRGEAICAMPLCLSKAIALCSCGINLCSVHVKGYTHGKHTKMPPKTL